MEMNSFANCAVLPIGDPAAPLPINTSHSCPWWLSMCSSLLRRGVLQRGWECCREASARGGAEKGSAAERLEQGEYCCSREGQGKPRATAHAQN
eukprot:1158493-Pelagomonas_calceolata.AAC.2